MNAVIVKHMTLQRMARSKEPCAESMQGHEDHV